MRFGKVLAFVGLCVLSACAAEGEAGDACETDDDCAEGLECHAEEGEEMVCEEDDGHNHDDE